MIETVCPSCKKLGRIERTPAGFKKISGCLHTWAEGNRYGFHPETTEEEIDLLHEVVKKWLQNIANLI